MVWIYLTKDDSKYNRDIIEWTRNNLQKNNIRYHLVFTSMYIFDAHTASILADDYILWNPLLASKNLDKVSSFKNSVIILNEPTPLSLDLKITEDNPINENLVVNYGLTVMYLNKEDSISNNEYRLVTPVNDYAISQYQLVREIMSDKTNIKNSVVQRKEMFTDEHSMLKQINLD